VPLSDDQKAMLRLLAQREQGYDDLAALMGLSVGDVRAKVKSALDQLEAEGEAPPSIEEAVVEQPAEVESPPPPAPDPPKAEPPAPASEAAAAEPTPATPRAEAAPQAPTPPAKAPTARPKLSLPAERGPRAALAAGVAVVALVVAILVLGGGGGGSGATTAASTEPTGTTEPASGTPPSSKTPTEAILHPVGGSGGSGVAVFGQVKSSLALQVEAQGVAPTRPGQSYTIWLAQSPQKMLPLASSKADKSGNIVAQFPVPNEVLGYLAQGTFETIAVTLTSNTTLKAALAKARSEKKAPIYTGTPVLSGKISGPIVGAAEK
jgi:hypothetical protein